MLPPEEDYTELDDYDEIPPLYEWEDDRYDCGCCMCCGCDCDNRFWWEDEEEEDESNSY